MPDETPPTIPNNSNGHGPAKKKRHGRVKKTLTLADWQEIEAMAGAGVSMAKIARVMELSEDTLRKWRKLRPELEAACRKGMARTEATIGRTLVEKAKAGDLGAVVWWEKTRAGRREMSDVTSGGKPLTAITYVIQSAAGQLIDEVEPESRDLEPQPEPKQLGPGSS